jgi:hypothetical protein
MVRLPPTTVRLIAELRESLDAEARRRSTSRSAMTRALLAEALTARAVARTNPPHDTARLVANVHDLFTKAGRCRAPGLAHGQCPSPRTATSTPSLCPTRSLMDGRWSPSRPTKSSGCSERSLVPYTR